MRLQFKSCVRCEGAESQSRGTRAQYGTIYTICLDFSLAEALFTFQMNFKWKCFRVWEAKKNKKKEKKKK